MSQVTPQIRAFAARLVAYATSDDKSSGTKAHMAFYACEKLRPHLATLMGNAGYRALLARALALAKPEVPWLDALQLQPDGALNGLNDLESQGLDRKQINDGVVVLLAHLLGLLVAFIGEVLTLRIVRTAWPRLPGSKFDFSQRIAK